MPTGDFDCPECGQPGAHFVPPSLGEAGFYYCEMSPQAQQRRAAARAARRWRPPTTSIEAAKVAALRNTFLDATEPPEFLIEPDGPDWLEVEVES